MEAVRYRDKILRLVEVPLVQQRQLILQQDNARPHVARVCRDFHRFTGLATIQSKFVANRAFVGLSRQKGKEASESPNNPRTIKK